MAFLRLLKVTGYLKTFIKIMVSLKFHDLSFKEDYIEMAVIPFDVSIVISITKGNEINEQTHIHLDRITAIKLSKELRKQIALIPY